MRLSPRLPARDPHPLDGTASPEASPQDASGIEITFLGLHGRLPLGPAVLFVAVAAAVLGLVIGTAWITRLRRPARRR